jgi:Radical SAM superfamily/B12 binding domain
MSCGQAFDENLVSLQDFGRTNRSRINAPLVMKLASVRVPRNPARVILIRPLTNSELNSPFFMPLGLLCIGALLDAAGHSVEIVDYEYLYRCGKHPISDTYIEDFCRPIVDRNPMVVGISVLADTLPLALLMSARLKSLAPRMKTVLGGPGVFGISYDNLVKRFPGAVDYICKAEGEESFLELVDVLSAGVDRPAVKGMIELSDGRVKDFGPRQFSVLDDLPPPAYHLVPLESYVAMASPRIFDVYVGTGCTFACKFCTTAPFWNRTFRAKSPERILSELDWLHDRLGINKFNLLHDNLANDRKYLLELVDYFESANKRYEWGCAVRPDSLSREHLYRLRAAGCSMMFCGTDSGSKKILKSMKKAAGTGRFYESFLNCRDAGIALETNTIIGYPDETDSDLEDSLSIVFDSVAYGSASSDVSILQPLPGAAVTDEQSDRLINVKTPLLGNFLPDEILTLVHSDPKMFPGFAFIKQNNRDYEFYCTAVRSVRYFTRHFFRTVYYLHSVCGVTYLRMFEWMSTEVDSRNYRTRFKRFLSELDLPEASTALVAAIFDYEDAIENLKKTDVSMEVTNVHCEPDSAVPDKRYVLFEARYEVPEIFGRLPELEMSKTVPKDASYLIFLDDRDEIVTLKLNPWQKRLWIEVARLERGSSSARLRKRFRAMMYSSWPIGDREADVALAEVLTLFQGVLRSRAERRDALGRLVRELAVETRV